MTPSNGAEHAPVRRFSVPTATAVLALIIIAPLVITGAVNPKSGKPRTLIRVDAPGERLDQPVPKKGHRGTRYTEGEDWPV